MARGIGSELPESVLAILGGSRIEEAVGRTFQVLTTDENGWPSLSLLSVGEIVAVSPTVVRLALWPGSTTTANLTRSGMATVVLLAGGVVHYIRLRATRGGDAAVESTTFAYFEGRVEGVFVDQVPYARVVGWITFDLLKPDAVIASWRATIRALLSAPSLAPSNEALVHRSLDLHDS
jgi:hypothetical protein